MAALPENDSDAAAALERLATAIARHNALYHTDDAPEISDADYDALVRRNAAIETAYPHLVRADTPSLAVGAAPASHLSKVAHARPMMSLDNGFADAEIVEFIARLRRFLRLDAEEAVALTAEPKIDGLSCSLRYEDRVLVRALTRGDGQVGEDVTANVRSIGDIPERLPAAAPDIFEIRGEVFMAKADFAAPQRAADQGRGGGCAPVRQPAQCRRRITPAERCAGDRLQAASLSCPWLGRSERGAGRHAI